MKAASIALAALIALGAGSAANAQEILADCGASSGYSYFPTGPEPGWTEDGVTGGSLRFTVDRAGAPNIVFVDATGVQSDAAALGARMSFSHRNPARGEFGIVLVYPDLGLAETYNVVRLTDGRRRLLWTANRPRPPQVDIIKVGAYTADCR